MAGKYNKEGKKSSLLVTLSGNLWARRAHLFNPVQFTNPNQFTMASSSISFNNIQRYNNLRDFLINSEGYTYKQLFGLKYHELDGLFYGDASIVYKVTNSKRAWLRVQLDRFVNFFDLQEG